MKLILNVQLLFNPQFFPIPKPISPSKNRLKGKLEPRFFLVHTYLNFFCSILAGYKKAYDFGMYIAYMGTEYFIWNL